MKKYKFWEYNPTMKNLRKRRVFDREFNPYKRSNEVNYLYLDNLILDKFF